MINNKIKMTQKQDRNGNLYTDGREVTGQMVEDAVREKVTNTSSKIRKFGILKTIGAVALIGMLCGTGKIVNGTTEYLSGCRASYTNNSGVSN